MFNATVVEKQRATIYRVRCVHEMCKRGSNSSSKLPYCCTYFKHTGWLRLENNFSDHFLPPASEGWGKVIFSVCSHLRGEGGYPIPGLEGGRGTPSKMRTGVPWVPLAPRSGRGIPHPADGGYPRMEGYPLSKTGWGIPPPEAPSPPHQQSEHVLRGGRCASCVHAGGLSFSEYNFALFE